MNRDTKDLAEALLYSWMEKRPNMTEGQVMELAAVAAKTAKHASKALDQLFPEEPPKVFVRDIEVADDGSEKVVSTTEIS